MSFDSGIVCEHPRPRLCWSALACRYLSPARGPCALCVTLHVHVLLYYHGAYHCECRREVFHRSWNLDLSAGAARGAGASTGTDTS